MGLVLAETDRGVAVVMGVPMFVIGVLFIVSSYRRRLKTTNSWMNGMLLSKAIWCML